MLANITRIEAREQGLLLEPKYAAVQRYNVNNLQHVRHENTRASKLTRLMEEELTIKLTKIVNQIKADNITELVNARMNFGLAVSDAIRSIVERVYRVGIDYVNEFINLDGFFTDFDLNKIKEISTQMTEEFWASLNKGIFTRNRLLLHSRDFKPKEDINVKYLMGIIASKVTVMTLNMATINKSRQIAMRADSLHVTPKIAIRAGHVDRPMMYFFSAAKMKQYLRAATKNYTFFSWFPAIRQTTLLVQAWITELDDDVCTRYQCAQLHGQYWEVGDPNIEVPPRHPNCRCRLILAEKSFADIG